LRNRNAALFSLRLDTKRVGIHARLHRVRDRTRDVAAALIEEAERLKVDLMVMGGYGHSRLREMLLGGVTYDASRLRAKNAIRRLAGRLRRHGLRSVAAV
jgi:Universal stress protein family